MNKILLPLTAVALCFTAQQAMAATSDGIGNAKAKIISPLTVTETTQMNFGTLLGDADYTVQLTTGGSRTCSNTGKCVADTNTPAAGVFTITNPGTAAVTATSITLPADNTVTVTGGNTTLHVNGFTSDFASGSIAGNNGTKTVNVGATLSVTNGADAGDYTGTYTVTVNY